MTTEPAHTMTPRCSDEQGASTLPERVTKRKQDTVAPSAQSRATGSYPVMPVL